MLGDIPELIDRVIDHLHDDEETLRACSLVARSWLPASRFHLFQTLYIFNEREFWALVELLQKNPGLGSHVRELALDILYDSYGNAEPWIRPPVDISPLTAHIPTIEVLTLSDDWTRYGEPNRTVILDSFRKVRTLTIMASNFYSIQDLLTLLRSFPLLERLNLDYVDIGEQGYSARVDEIPLTLSALQVTIADDVQSLSWQAIAPSLVSPRMDRLWLPLATEDDMILVDMYCSFAQSNLKELHLDMEYMGYSSPELHWNAFILPSLCHLQDLHLGPVRLSTDDSARACAHALEAFLCRRQREYPYLSRIEIQLTGPEPPIARTVYFWTPVVRALVASNGKDVVECRLTLIMPDRKSERRTLRFVHAAVPQSVDAGIIRVLSSRSSRDFK